jgi:FkbM family methyltransferase
MRKWRVRVKDGSTVCVPVSPSYLTTYVLLEQEDWFEKEIAFVRRVIEPGMRAVDVGANFGIYTSVLARGVGPEGRVWALEPASTTLEYLRETMIGNDFIRVEVVRLALSDHSGVAKLGIDRNSELNSLTVTPGQPTEEVPVETLDGFAAAVGLTDIDFFKLDAEGEELRILAAGQHFMHTESPLVMFEVKAGTKFNDGLPTAFRELGYEIYKLVGPDRLLVPCAPGETLDPYELNLFACKPERAAHLAARGLLARAYGATENPDSGAGVALCAAQVYGPALPATLSQAPTSYAQALDAYALWRDETASCETRAAALRSALAKACVAAQESQSSAVLSSAARIADEAGTRSLAVELLGALLARLQRGGAPEYPCWPACPRYDHVAVTSDTHTWLLAAAAEAYVTRVHFSGYFSKTLCRPLLEWLQDTPYASPAMERRRQLTALHAGEQQQLYPSPLLQAASADHLNPEFWNGESDKSGTSVLSGT